MSTADPVLRNCEFDDPDAPGAMRSLSKDLLGLILSTNSLADGLLGEGGGRSAPEDEDEPSILCINLRRELDGEPERDEVESFSRFAFVASSCAASFSAAACRLCGWWYWSMLDAFVGESSLFLCRNGEDPLVVGLPISDLLCDASVDEAVIVYSVL